MGNWIFWVRTTISPDGFKVSPGSTVRITRRFVVLIVVLALMVSCTTTSNNPHDNWVLFSEDTEKSMGKSSAQELEKKVGVYSGTFSRYVDNVGSRVAVYSQRSELDYTFKVLDSMQTNALALPGGYVYATRGLINLLESEAELASILGHEIAHVAAYHSLKRQQLSVITMLTAAAVATQSERGGVSGSMMAQQSLIRGYTRSAESQADKLGMRYVAKAGYDPVGFIRSLEVLNEIQKENPRRDLLMIRTHPFLTDRIRKARNRLSRFQDIVGDTPLRGKDRFTRNKRRYLFKPDEKDLLRTFNQFIEAYRHQNTSTMRDLMSPDFKLGGDDSSDTVSDFMSTIENRVKRSKRIEYETRLVGLDVSDTDAYVVYEYLSRRWEHNEPTPTIQDGHQIMVWRRNNRTWRLTRLR